MSDEITITLAEARKLSTDAAIEIDKIVKAFQERTYLRVTDVDLEHASKGKRARLIIEEL